jgi:hypothetical protein
MGQAQTNGDNHDDDKKKNTGPKLTFVISITDPDKTGNEDNKGDEDKKASDDQFSITVTDSIGNIIYQNSGTVKGHIEIHNGSDSHDKDKSSGDKDDKSDSGNNHNNDNNNKK